MAVHERQNLIRAFRSEPASDSLLQGVSEIARGAVAGDLEVLQRQVLGLPHSAAQQLEWHLRHFRSAFLMVRSLQPEGGTDWPTHFNLENLKPMNLAGIVFNNPSLGIRFADELKDILETLENLIREMGFDGAEEHLSSGEANSLPGSGLSRHPVNIIPGSGSAFCADTVVGLFRVASSKKPATRFRTIMADLRTHLVECPATRNIILLTDWWNSDVFENEHFSELAARKRSGQNVLVLLVSQPGSQITPLQVLP
jgi:hypothetical protein